MLSNSLLKQSICSTTKITHSTRIRNNIFSHFISIYLTLVLFHLSMTCSITTSMFEVVWWLANSLLSLIKNWFFNICSILNTFHYTMYAYVCTEYSYGTFKCQLTNVNGFCPNKITTGNHKNCTHTSVQLGIKYIRGKRKNFVYLTFGSVYLDILYQRNRYKYICNLNHV